MNLVINSSDNYAFKIGAIGIEDIQQCLHVLLSTIEGSIFLDRELGISSELIDSPLTKLGNLNQEIFNKIGMYEPRVKVKDIKITGNNSNGKAIIRLEVEILEEYL